MFAGEVTRFINKAFARRAIDHLGGVNYAAMLPQTHILPHLGLKLDNFPC
jgi:hypothetical protein